MAVPISRRAALRFAGAITAAAHLPGHAQVAARGAGRGYGTDPSMMNPVVTWPLTLAAAQRAALAAVCDLVLPSQGSRPSAGECGIHEFLDEWLSAPYPRMQQDREQVTRALLELDRITMRSHHLPFAQAARPDQAAAFAAFAADEGPGRSAAIRIVNLICGGYFTTPAGHADMGYVGNQALAEFAPPAPEVVRQLEAAVADLATRWPKSSSLHLGFLGSENTSIHH